MKKAVVFLSIICLAVGMGLMGCTQKAASSSEAIKQAETKQTVDEKVDYLVGQANAFINSQEFNEAIKTAQYILSNLDKDSEKAKSIIEKAKMELEATAKKAAGDMANKLGLGNN